MALVREGVVVRVNLRQKVMVMRVVTDRMFIRLFVSVKRSAKAMMICCVIKSR